MSEVDKNLPSMTPSRQVVEELQILRRGRGMSQAKLRRCSVILALEQVTTRARNSITSPECAAYDLIAEHALRETDHNGRILRNALAIGNDIFTGNITARRIGLALGLEMSLRTVVRREDEGFEALSDFLRGPVDQGKGVLYAGRGYRIASLDTTYRLGPQRVPTTLTRTLHIVATEDGCETISLGQQYLADPTPGVVQVGAVEGAESDHEEEIGSGYYSVQYRLPKPLVAGKPHRIAVTLNIDTPEPTKPFYYSVPWVETALATIRVQFDPTDSPDVVWHFESLPVQAVPGRPSPIVQLDTSRLGMAEWKFLKPPFGFAYGIAWQWPD